MTRDLYKTLAHQPYHEVRVGGLLATLIQPHEGREREYNRWYEDDHFYAGVMQGPWAFAGRRFVAPRSVRHLGFPAESPLGDPKDLGSFLAVYLLTEGHVEDFNEWATETMVTQLAPAGRGFTDRTHIYTAVHDLAGAYCFDPPPMQAFHALDHPYGGIVVELVDAPAPERRDELIDWLMNDFIPAKGGDGAVGQCLCATPRPFPAEVQTVMGWEGQDPTRRVCLLWLLKGDPRDVWPLHFGEHAGELADSDRGNLVHVAPLIPVIPGTDEYIAELE